MRRAGILGATWLLLAVGCRPAPTPSDANSTQPSATTPAPPLRLIVFDDPALAEQIRQQWQAKRTEPLDVQARTYDVTESTSLDADMVIAPVLALGELAEWAVIVPWPGTTWEDDEASRHDVFSLQRLRVPIWGKRLYAVPLGAPPWFVYARRDIEAAQADQPPATWKAYAARVASLAKAIQADRSPPVPFAAAEPLGPTWASRVLLARAAPYVRHASQYSDLFDYTDMRPLIAEPPYVRALEELAEVARHAPPEVLEATPETVKRWFYEGRIALALAWPSGNFALSSLKTKRVRPNQVAFWAIPGARRAYHFEWNSWEDRHFDDPGRVPFLGVAGRVGAIVRGTRHREAAARALAWLASRDVSAELLAGGATTAAFRFSHSDNPDWIDRGLGADQATAYGEIMRDAGTAPRALLGPRLPGYRRYVAALDEAVHKVVRGKATAKEALAEAARQWEAITDQLGRDLQKRAYQRSIGLAR